MAQKKLIDNKNFLNGAIPALTPWTFVRAGGLANLLVATLVFIEFSAIALINHDGNVGNNFVGYQSSNLEGTTYATVMAHSR